MIKSGTLTTVFAPPAMVAYLVGVGLLIAATALILSSTESYARTETAEEVSEILATLDAEKCEVVRDAMGEKKLSMEGANFIIEATCADDKSYTFTLDQNFKVIDKKVIEN